MGTVTKCLLTLLFFTSFSFSMVNVQSEYTSNEENPIIVPTNPPEFFVSSECQSAWIILAGDTEHHNDTEAIKSGCNKTYEILRAAGFTSDKIFYIGPEVDSETQPYVNTSSTKINLKWAIEQWAPLHVNSSQSLGLYLLSHGDVNALAVMVADVLWDYNLNSYLNNFEANTGCKRVVVVIEGCHSGSFIDTLSKENRIIVTSTSTYQGAAFNADRTWGAFSESFWSSIVSCATIGEAFNGAVDHIRFLGKNQSPKIDDNHDGIGTTPYPNDNLPSGGEGFDALNVMIQAKQRFCIPEIQIQRVPLPMFEVYDPFSCSAIIEVEIESSTGISKVYARFVPSDWEPDDPLNGYMNPLNDNEIHMIELESPTRDEVYVGDVAFDRLNLGDSFMVNILAYDSYGYVADIVSTYLFFNSLGEAPPDTVPPSVVITREKSFAAEEVSDNVDITVRGDDDQELNSLELYIDGVLVDSVTMPDYYPYPELKYVCDTKDYKDGTHNFTAIATDHEGLTNHTSVLVLFENEKLENTNSFTVILGSGSIVIFVISTKVYKIKIKDRKK